MTPSKESYRTIPLTKNKTAIVDIADFPILSRHRWYALKSKGKFYAARKSSMMNGIRHTILMHRVILGLEFGDPRQGDHGLRDTLDNRKIVNGKENLRIASHIENTWNSIRKGSSLKGTSKERHASPLHPWRARITIHGKEKIIGYFETEESANEAYEREAIKHFGRFARAR